MAAPEMQQRPSKKPRLAVVGYDRRQRSVSAAPLAQPTSIPPPPKSRSRQASSAPEQPQASSSRIIPPAPQVPSGYGSLFTDGQTCSRCNHPIPLFNRNLGSTLERGPRGTLGPLLHMTCPSCAAVQCRGCSKPAACPRRCGCGDQCTLVACCSKVRAIAIFELLVDFDAAYADKVVELHGGSGSRRNMTRAERDVYLHLAGSWADPQLSLRLDGVLGYTLEKLTRWLAGDVHELTPLLISSSHLLEVIQAFVASPKGKNWVRRRTLYRPMLEFLIDLASRHSLHDLVMRRRKDVQGTCGLQVIVASADYYEDGPPSVSTSLCDTALCCPAVEELRQYASTAYNQHFKDEAEAMGLCLKSLDFIKMLGPSKD